MADEVTGLETEKVVKGGEVWLEMTIDRKTRGVELWVRVDSRVEEFVAALNEGDPGTDHLHDYTTAWVSVDTKKPIQVRRYQTRSIDTLAYSLSTIGGSFTNGPKGSTNLAFLRFVGIGTPDGVRFFLPGPMGRASMRSIKDEILVASRQLFRDYISPAHINLRITSTEI